MPNRVLVDSGYLVALSYTYDKNHARAVAFEQTSTHLRVIPDAVLPEVGHLLKNYLGQAAVESFLAALIDSPAQLQSLSKEDLRRAHEIMQFYRGARLDLVDCCLMALSERLDITQICTFDRRDFSIFRPRHCTALELLP